MVLSSAASIALIGSMVGAVSSGMQFDFWGRKKTMMSTQIVALFGFVFLRFANSIPMLFIGNFLGGYTEGVYLFAAPVYTAEINQPRIRNYTLSFNVLAFYICFSFTYVIGSMVSWRQTISILMVLPCIFFFLLFLCPDSPTWHMLKGRKDTALELLIKLRGDELVAKNEIERINENMEKQKLLTEKSNTSSYYKEQLAIITKGTFIRPCIVLMVFFAIGWQWTGETSLTFYTVNIVQQFNIPISAYWISAGMGCYQFLIAILGVLLSAIVPRRRHYTGSGILVILGAFMLGTFSHLQKYNFFVEFLEANPVFRWIPILAFLILLGGYASGYVGVCHMLLGELLPSNGRAIGSCIVMQINYVSNFLVTKFTPSLIEILGMDGLFWLFSAIATVSVIFGYFCMPETFGFSLEEIEEHYRTLCYPNMFKKRKDTT